MKRVIPPTKDRDLINNQNKHPRTDVETKQTLGGRHFELGVVAHIFSLPTSMDCYVGILWMILGTNSKEM